MLTTPNVFFREMPLTGGIGSPLGYALILGYTGAVFSTIFEFVIVNLRGSPGGSLALPAGVMASEASRLGLRFILPLVLVFFVPAVVHLALRAVGGAGHGFEATFRVTCYTEASALLNIIPLVGGMIALLVKAVLIVIGISEVHVVTPGRAAVLLIILASCCVMSPFLLYVVAALLGGGRF